MFKLHKTDCEGVVVAWGSEKEARRVRLRVLAKKLGLSVEDTKDAIKGRIVVLTDCPDYQGCTDRMVIEYGNKYYTRMPIYSYMNE